MPTSPAHLPSLPTLLLSLLALPSFLGVGFYFVPSAPTHRTSIPSNAASATVLPTWKRQTIAEQSIPASEYEWSGEGDGTDICKRWSHQSAVVNDRLYIYGGQATTDPGSDSHNWNSNFLYLDLAQEWDRANAPFYSLPSKGPPPVANGYLWHDLDNIYLYGGLFSDTPPVFPTKNSLWKFNIKDNKWTETPVDDFEVSDDTEQKKIERAAEGAGCNVIKKRGDEIHTTGYYFGGHLDGYTTEGWSQNTPRVYLKSMVEFHTETGLWRNVSEGSGLDKAGVPSRADGVLVYAPLGKEGILIGIGGGREADFSQLNTVDIYDIETSTWFKQATSGPTPKYRVNPCAAVSSAPDLSSHNIYFFGGQNLQPYGDQEQYDDMWILTLPSFTWIEVDQKDQSVPAARAGHSCHIHGGQLIVVGGYVSKEITCDSPGIYIFDVTKLEWKNHYNPPSKDSIPDDPEMAALNIAPVAEKIIEVVGGGATGGATATVPVRSPEPDSPLGEPPVYTVTSTASDGSLTTVTTTANPHTSSILSTPSGIPDSAAGSNGKRIGAIVGGVLGGIVLILLIGFAIAWIMYKRKLKQLRSERLGSVSSAGGLSADGRTESMRQVGSTGDLLGEPSFWGVMVSRRRSLRVVNN